MTPPSPLLQQENNHEGFIDEGLYSRQLYVLGHEAMRRMQRSNVLIVGMKGLGLEIAKNVILAGVKSVTIWDACKVEIADLSAQYYLSEGDLGRRRDECTHSQLAELNNYVPVKVLETLVQSSNELLLEENVSLLKDFQVVVLTEAGWADQLAWNDWTHLTGRAFIAADTAGLFGRVFCDFGEEFVVADATGEQVVTGMISAITQEPDSVVTCLEDQRHGLEDGDVVKFREVKGMTELNEPSREFKVKVLSPFTFSIGDTLAFAAYQTGGIFEQVKQPQVMKFKSLRESMQEPEFVISDFAKMDRMHQVLLSFSALPATLEARPKPRNTADAAEFVERVKGLAPRSDMEFDVKLLEEFAKQSRGYLAPMCAVLGGLVAQEALKASSGKFGPIYQHFIFDALEALPVDLSPLEADFAARGSRYDGQIAVFGREFQDRLESARGFLVGAGAIGCEMLKLYALMGIGAGEGRRKKSRSSSVDSSASDTPALSAGANNSPGLVVTDMDNIEKSNLNRQFLFRSGDVGRPKSLTAAEAAFRINPNVRVEALVDRVGVETENIFTSDFFESLDFVTNALDNVEARRYMDQRCVFYCRPLLESGTLGTKGNTQVVIPHLTESYSSSQDPPEKTIPFCTLHNFPNSIEHTIQWAMDFFSGTFRGDAESVNRLLQYARDLPPGSGSGSSVWLPDDLATQKDRMEVLVKNVEAPKSFADCVRWACLRFQELFSSNIRQLLFNFPLDSMTSSGTPFWSGPKRAPTPIDFNPASPMHLDFVEAAAHLRAQIYGVPSTGLSRAEVQQLAGAYDFPPFTPRSGIKIAANDAEASTSAAPSPINDAEMGLASLRQELETIVAGLPVGLAEMSLLQPHEFEKDNDSNHHIDFIAACANLRAANYEITAADRHVVKGVAGKIIPAIATTTALVSGLIALELYKVLDGPNARVLESVDFEAPDFMRHWNLDRFKNGFVNLALPFFAFSSPLPAPKHSFDGGKTHFTLWSSFRLHLSQIGNLQNLLKKIREDHGLIVTMLSCGPSLLYSSYMPKTGTPERLGMPLDQLVSTVGKKVIPEHCDVLVMEALCENADGEDVEFPYITLYLKK